MCRAAMQPAAGLNAQQGQASGFGRWVWLVSVVPRALATAAGRRPCQIPLLCMVGTQRCRGQRPLDGPGSLVWAPLPTRAALALGPQTRTSYDWRFQGYLMGSFQACLQRTLSTAPWLRCTAQVVFRPSGTYYYLQHGTTPHWSCIPLCNTSVVHSSSPCGQAGGGQGLARGSVSAVSPSVPECMSSKLACRLAALKLYDPLVAFGMSHCHVSKYLKASGSYIMHPAWTLRVEQRHLRSVTVASACRASYCLW